MLNLQKAAQDQVVQQVMTGDLPLMLPPMVQLTVIHLYLGLHPMAIVDIIVIQHKMVM